MKLDARGAYSLLRVKERDQHKLAFRTRYGLFEPPVIQFGITNAPVDFQGYINNAIREALDDFASAYLDDVLIYSNSEEEHIGHVKWIVQRLLEAGLYLKPEKCEFHKETGRYLGLIKSTKGISMDEDKVETIRNWSRENKTKNGRLNNLFEVQQFLGFCNYYQRFIPTYSEKAEPLTKRTMKNEPCVWESGEQLAFQTMITAFTTALELRHFDHEREVIIETDASDYVSAGVLSQRDDEGILHPVAYFSKKHSPAECNYAIYDKELMAIVKALEEWPPECEGAAYPLQLITDHKNLESFMTKKLLNRGEAQCSEFLTRFDYEIVYRPGKLKGNADALIRRPGDLPETGDERLKNMEQVVRKLLNLPKEFRLFADSPPARGRPSISELMSDAYETDPLPGIILEAIHKNGGWNDITIAESAEQDGRIQYRGKWNVPQSDQLRLRLI